MKQVILYQHIINQNKNIVGIKLIISLLTNIEYTHLYLFNLFINYI